MHTDDDVISPKDFIDAASDLMAKGFDDEFDVPEVWEALAAMPAEDVSALYRWHGRHPPRSPLIRDVHPMASEVWRMLLNLLGFHAGTVTADELTTFAEYLLSFHSQAPIVAGFVYRARQITGAAPAYDLRDHVCTRPFEELDVLEQSTHLCCASWLHKSAGNLTTQSHDEVWTSPAAVAIRQSIADGSYRYCNKVACPAIPGRQLTPKSRFANDPWWQNAIATGQVDRGPRRVNLAYDRHCNLSCPSCRETLITSNDEVRAQLDKITQRAIYPLLRTADEAFITGSGDPFASRTFRKLLAWISDETCPNLKIVLMTNGMLFTEKEWAKFPNLKGKVRLAKISVDGASKATHESLRRGSKWEVMMENLPFIGSLVANSEIDALELVFVVQMENFREMGAFVDLAKRIGAQKVAFERITNWGTFTQDDYEEKAVFSPTHPFHDEFRNVMTDPRLADPMVILGSLAEFLPRIQEAA